MPKSVRLIAVAVMAAVAFGAFAFAQDEGKKDEAKKPKHTIEEVMEIAMAPKGSKLNKKVLSGKATQEEKLELLDLFISLVENKPPKGEEASWQRFSGAAALAAAKVAVGREDATKELKTATNCTKCHKAHRPKKEE